MKAFKRTLALLLVASLSLSSVPLTKALPDESQPTESVFQEIIEADDTGNSNGDNTVAIDETTAVSDLIQKIDADTVVITPEETLADPIESVPNETTVSKEETPPTDVIPETPSESAPVETPNETTPPKETKPSSPMEDLIPAETVPEETNPSSPMEGLIPAETIPEGGTDWVDLVPAEEVNDYDIALHPGDTLTLWNDPTVVSDEVDGIPYSARSMSIVNTRSYWIDATQFSHGFPSYTSNLQYFEMSNGSIGYCLQPGHNDPDKNFPLEGGSWNSSTKQAVALAMAYGAPNNSMDWQETYEWRIATSAVIWDIVTGHRGANGQLTNGPFQTGGKGPFEAKLKNPYYEDLHPYDNGHLTAAGAGDKYDMIIYRMKLHGTIPSFTSKSVSSINSNSTVTLKRGSDGYYYGSLHDSNGILSAFSYYESNPYSGLTIKREGSTLNFKATEEVAKKIGRKGIILSSRRSNAPVSTSDLLLWTDREYSSNGLPHQLVVTMPPIDPVPSFFKVVTDVEPATMTIQKTSDSNELDGYCFNIYRQKDANGPDRTWRGKSDASGNVFETDSNYVSKGNYTFTGLTDGSYAFREVLSQSTHGGETFPTKWVIKLWAKGASSPHQVYTFNSDRIIRDTNGDALLDNRNVPIYGVEGGGKVTMEIYNKVQSNDFTLKKSVRSSDQGVINSILDNKCYSLAGAQYEVWHEGVVKEVLTTNANGEATSRLKYPIGAEVQVKEIVAPNGFLIDNSPVTVRITEGDNVAYVSDLPSFDPRTIRFEKIDKSTGKPQGGTSFKGAVFKWEYYDNYNWSGDPKRVWYFKTNDYGVLSYGKDFLDYSYNNSDLYVNDKGRNSLPLGSLKVTEVSAPDGYSSIQTLYAKIEQRPEDGKAKFKWTPESEQVVNGHDGNYTAPEPVDKNTYGSVQIQKKDKDFDTTAPTWATFKGCEFTVYNNSTNAISINDKVINPGEPCIVISLDDKGYAKTDSIFPIGDYTVKETKGNEYYQCNTEWVGSFSVKKEAQDNPTYTVSCTNTLKPATISIEKVDPYGNHLAGAKFMLEYSTDGSTWNKVFSSNEIKLGGCSSPNLASDGTLTTDSSGVITFTGLYPVLYYRITEVEAPEGFTLLKDPLLTGKLDPSADFNYSARVVNTHVFTMVETGSKEIPMYGMLSAMLATMSVLMITAAKKKKRGL